MATKIKKVFNTCHVMRRRKVSRGTLNVFSGDMSLSGTSWEVEPCGTPLFHGDLRAAGVCKGCRDGWRTADSYPADAEGNQIPEGGQLVLAETPRK